MESEKETLRTIQGRLEILKKALVSEENSVQYYDTLCKKVPEDSEQKIGAKRMFQELREHEKEHVTTLQALIDRWSKKLHEIESE